MATFRTEYDLRPRVVAAARCDDTIHDQRGPVSFHSVGPAYNITTELGDSDPLWSDERPFSSGRFRRPGGGLPCQSRVL